MLKKSLLLMMLFAACFGVARADEVTIGSLEGAANNSYLPMNSLYNYSYTQQIYTADEIGMAGTINSITMWLYGNANLYEMPFDIYMVETDKDAYSSNTDWVTVTSSDIVYSGTVTVHNTTAEAYTFELDNPFTYSGQGNLLIAFNNTTGQWKSGLNGKVFGANGDAIRAIYARQDGSAYDPTNPISAYGTTYQRNVVLIDITPGSGPVCNKPETLEVSNLTAYEADLTWTGGSGTYNVEYKAASDEEWIVLGENVTYTTYNFTTLDPATTYNFHVQSVCDGDVSGWKAISFTTECAAITSFPWTENFDSYTAASGFLPICWSRINTGTSYATYPYIYGYNAHSTSNCLYFYYYGSSSNTAISDQYAILPVMENLAGKQINLYAKGYNNQSTFKIGTITDPTDATTFTAFATQELTTSYQEFIYFVPASTTDNYLAIMMERPNTSSYVYRGVYIDDITINFPPACPKPTALTVGEVTAHTAQLSWTSDADAWQVMVNNDTINAFDVTTNPYILEDLVDGESYTVTVRANCDVDGYSEWSNNVSFTTPIACPAPTGLAATDITGHTAKLNWTGNSDSYIVNYRKQVSAEEGGFFDGFTTTTFGEGSVWERYTGLLEYVLSDSIELATTTSGWNVGTGNGVFDKHAKINIWSTNIRYWLVTPSVEVAANYVFDFDLALTKYSGTLQPVVDTLQQDDKFVVLISTDDMETWTILRQWDNAGSEYVYNNIACTATGEHVSFNLSAYVGQNVRIAFYGESTVAGGDNNLHIDNVVVGIPIPASEWMTATSDTTTCTLTGLIPETDYEVYVESVCEGETSHVTNHITITTDVACPAPTAITVANITPTSADLSWTTSADAWEVEVSYNIPAIVTTLVANTNPFTVTDLIPETEYTVRVRANCGDEGYSEWSTPATFTTLVACPVPFDVEVSDITYNSAKVAWTGYSESYILNWAYGEIHTLLNENFEDQTIPADWTNTATADTLIWTVVTDTIHNSYYMISGNAGVASSTSEVSFVMTYPVDGIIEFDAQCMGEGTSWDVCRFLIDDNIKLAKGANGSQWDHYSFAVTAGEHTFTWRYSKDSSVNPTGDHFAVDNIKMYYENLISQDPITTENSPYTFTGLTPETNYYVTVTGVCGDEQTEASEMVDFTTLTASQTITLTTGFNWVSSYIEITLADLQDALVEALPATAGIKINSQSNGTTTYNGSRWRGQLTSLDLSQMYMVEVPIDCQITLVGMPINPAEHPATIHNGTNWLAFPIDGNMTLTNAFAGFVINGDKVTSQTNGSATYTGRWRGQLINLETGNGYLYESSATNDRTFTFPVAK